MSGELIGVLAYWLIGRLENGGVFELISDKMQRGGQEGVRMETAGSRMYVTVALALLLLMGAPAKASDADLVKKADGHG